MAIECLSSTPIFNEYKQGSVNFTEGRNPNANYCGIKNKNFIQYFVNPKPNKKMIRLEEKVSKIEIFAEAHMNSVSYIMNFLDNSGNILNTYTR